LVLFDWIGYCVFVYFIFQWSAILLKARTAVSRLYLQEISAKLYCYCLLIVKIGLQIDNKMQYMYYFIYHTSFSLYSINAFRG